MRKKRAPHATYASSRAARQRVSEPRITTGIYHRSVQRRRQQKRPYTALGERFRVHVQAVCVLASPTAGKRVVDVEHDIAWLGVPSHHERGGRVLARFDQDVVAVRAADQCTGGHDGKTMHPPQTATPVLFHRRFPFVFRLSMGRRRHRTASNPCQSRRDYITNLPKKGTQNNFSDFTHVISVPLILTTAQRTMSKCRAWKVSRDRK